MSKPRWGHSATRLQNGRVLITGPDQEVTAELYDPATGTFMNALGALPEAQSGHAATLLANGRVLISGGGYTSTGPTSGYHGGHKALLFDPQSETFAATGDLKQDRLGHTATLLSDGRVLIAGGATVRVEGFFASITRLSAAELFDPAAGTSRNVPSMAVTRREHSATLLSNGQVLVAGDDADVTAELFDPGTERWVTVGPMAIPRRRHTATRLSDGQVLIAGGVSLVDGSLLAEAEIYDPVSRTFRRVRSMPGPRMRHAAALLDDGRVLIVGGESDHDLRTAVVFHPASERFSEVSPMMVERMDATATALQDGRVLITGGTRNQPPASPIGELYVETESNRRRNVKR
jgi:hypothetical protein